MIIIMRGLPGSGKSYVARQIRDNYNAFSGKAIIASADNYFTLADGRYVFDHRKIGAAHDACYEQAKNAINSGKLAIIDNTNTQFWEFKKYVLLSKKVCIVQPRTDWFFDVNECAKRNTHGVPIETIQKMHDRFEHNHFTSMIECGYECVDLHQGDSFSCDVFCL